jgi:hypothetical protein
VPVDARRLIPPNYNIITRKMCHRGPSAGLSSDFHTAWATSCRQRPLGQTKIGVVFLRAASGMCAEVCGRKAAAMPSAGDYFEQPLPGRH